MTCAAVLLLPPGRAALTCSPLAQGNDGAAGTRDEPWATLHRASAQLRWLRAVNPAQLSGGGVHVWVKSEPDAEVYSELSYRS
jgi:hypothetical protein